MRFAVKENKGRELRILQSKEVSASTHFLLFIFLFYFILFEAEFGIFEAVVLFTIFLHVKDVLLLVRMFCFLLSLSHPFAFELWFSKHSAE